MICRELQQRPRKSSEAKVPEPPKESIEGLPVGWFFLTTLVR